MKKLLIRTLSLAVLLGISRVASAGTVEPSLQATVLAPQYAAAAAQAVSAVRSISRARLVPIMGNTRIVSIGGPDYFLYIPIYGIQVPLSPEQPTIVGEIVAELTIEPNSPIPSVKAVYYKPAASLP